MRYRSLEEVVGKYGLTVDLDEKAQLSDWESRLKKLLDTKQRDLPNAKNPSLRHKVERECAEVEDAFKFVSQQNVFTRLRRCVEEDKQEIFEHELKKPECRSILPSESEPEYDQYLEIKAAARKKWANISVQAATATSVAFTAAAAPQAAAPQPSPVATPGELLQSAPKGPSVMPPTPATPKAEPLSFAPKTDLAASNPNTNAPLPAAIEQSVKKVEEKSLPVAGASTLAAIAPAAAATVAAAEKTAEQKATPASQTALSEPTANLQTATGLQTETATSKTAAIKEGLKKIPVKKEHVSAALDILVKIRALMGFGGAFSWFKIIATAMAVFFIALAGLITELTREHARRNGNFDKTEKVPSHEEATIAGKSSPEPAKQDSELTKPSVGTTNVVIEPPKDSGLAQKTDSSQATNPPVEPPKPPIQIAKQDQQQPALDPPLEHKSDLVEHQSEPPLEHKTEPPPKPKMQLALLRIDSTPRDAAISINGTKQPLRTPAEFNLPPGNYDVALAIDCYSSASTTLHLDGGENRILTRELQSLQPALAIRTMPAGAMIYIDGSPRNQRTPATITGVEPGDHSVKVELAGYRSQFKAVNAKCGETLAVDFNPLERPTARVSITSNARGASVWVDGSDSGQTTPCSVELPLGEHRVRLVGPQGYRPEEKRVFVQDEQSVRLDVPLAAELVAIPANNPAPQRQYIPDAAPPPIPDIVVWCGLDYSLVKMIGTSRDFPVEEFFPNAYDRRGRAVEPMTSAWNSLFVKEVYPHLGRELGTTVQMDLSGINARNAHVTAQQIVQEESSPIKSDDNGSIFNPTRLLHHGKGEKILPTHISDADLAAEVRSYRLETRRGIGLVFVMDRLVQKEETGCFYVVFFDLQSRRILSSERFCERAGGNRYRNYWYNPIKEMLKRLPAMYQDARSKR
jgi:hypothetical protein